MPTWTALTHVIGREAAANLADLCEDLLPEPVGTGIFEIEDGSDRWEVGIRVDGYQGRRWVVN